MKIYGSSDSWKLRKTKDDYDCAFILKEFIVSVGYLPNHEYEKTTYFLHTLCEQNEVDSFAVYEKLAAIDFISNQVSFEKFVYVACPFTANPWTSIKRSYKELDKLHASKCPNTYYFSPIVATYGIDIILQDDSIPYVDWDLSLLEFAKTNWDVVMMFPVDYPKSKGCMKEHRWAIDNEVEVGIFDY